jgi:tRNA(Ile)-lysidine synthase
MSNELPTTHLADERTLWRRLTRMACVSQVAKALAEAGLTRHDKVIVGCSGGPDSTALLVALWLLRQRLPLTVKAVCIDHGLRAHAQQEAAQVMQVAERLGFTALVQTVQVPKQASLQAAARQARYEALLGAARDFGSEVVLVGHTQNDQAETLLLRLLGGTGLRGLAAMAIERTLGDTVGAAPIRLLRPLLSVTRAEVLALLAHTKAITAPLPLSDPSNHDFRFTRAVVRHKVLPELQHASPAIVGQLGRLADQLREDADLLDELAQQSLPQLLVVDDQEQPDVLASLSATRLYSLPKPLSTRLLMQVVGKPLATVQLEAILSLCAQSHGSRSLNLSHGLWAERRYDTLYLRKRQPQTRAPVALQWLPTYGLYQQGRHTLLVRAARPQEQPASTPLRLCVTLPAPGFPLWLRPPKPGDRLRLSAGHRKLSDVMIDAKIPRSERSHQLVLGFGEEPLWLLGIQSAATRFEPLGPAVTLVVERYEAEEKSPL